MVSRSYIVNLYHQEQESLQQDIFEKLSLRLGKEILGKRLAKQAKRSARLYSPGEYSSLHLENFKLIHAMLKTVLLVTGQYKRARENTMDYHVETHDIHLPRSNGRLKGIQILQITDLHLDAIPDQGEKLNHLINKTKADLLVMTGDFRFNDYGDYYQVSKILQDFVKGFDFPHGIYGILGNHDFIETVSFIEDLGIRMLINEKEMIHINGANLLLSGIDDAHFYNCHKIPTIDVQSSSADIKILLSHTPETFKEAEKAGYDLILSGHTHGGQVCLPGRIPIMTNTACPRKFCSGAWNYKKIQGYTSRGVGVSGLAVRLFCPPEITLHRFV